MKYPVTRFKSLKICLKELQPFILNGEHLQTGKPFKRFGGLRSRELLANWLICAVLNHVAEDERFTFLSDPLGGDGIIWDSDTERTWPTEHVMVPRGSDDDNPDSKALILAAINHKVGKGEIYASGRTLVVFLDSGGEPWFPNQVAKELPDPLHFDAVWVVGLQHVLDGVYTYGVAQLDLTTGNAPTWLITVAKDFDAWAVEALQG